MHLVRFVKDWTLPLAMGLGAAFYFLFAYTPALHEASLFFAPIMEAILPLFMFLVLFVTFCKVDFHKLRPVAWHGWAGLFQLLFVVLLIVPAISRHPSASTLVLLEAILMCVISPCATAAAVVTQKLGGSLEQMTTYTFLSNFLTVLLVPVCFPLLEPSANITF